jgi:hypothetical protein
MLSWLLDFILLALESLASNEIRDIVIILIGILTALALLLLHVLVALGKLSERGERIGTELVEDTGDELRELLVLTLTVDGEGVGGNSSVDCD